jgi:hypothetical protein
LITISYKPVYFCLCTKIKRKRERDERVKERRVRREEQREESEEKRVRRRE